MRCRNLLFADSSPAFSGRSEPGNTPATSAPDTRTPVFFYIGKARARVSVLAEACETGYAVENVAGAIPVLKRIPASDEPGIDFILVNETAAHTLEKLQDYLISSRYRFIPLVLELECANEATLAKYRHYGFLDDIITVGQPTASLLSRMALIAKVKSMPVHAFDHKIENAHHAWVRRRAVKRIADQVAAAAAIVLLGPLFLLTAGLIRLESRGPVLAVASRAGRGFRVFRSYTFRTAFVTERPKLQPLLHLAPGVRRHFVLKQDERPEYTNIGMLLVKTGLYQLPQLFNVLFGDISMIGSRPLPLQTAAGLTTAEHAARLTEPVGLTGLLRAGTAGE